MSLTGEIQPQYQADLGFLVNRKILERPVDVGTEVKKDDFLARLDPQQYQQDLEVAKAEVAKAEAEVARSQAQEYRQPELLKNGHTTQVAYEQALKTEFAEATPILAITLVLFSVFVPIAFIAGVSGTLFRQFAVTIGVAMAISALNTLTLSPALCAVFLRHSGPKRGVMGWVLRRIDNVRDGYAGLRRNDRRQRHRAFRDPDALRHLPDHPRALMTVSLPNVIVFRSSVAISGRSSVGAWTSDSRIVVAGMIAAARPGGQVQNKRVVFRAD